MNLLIELVEPDQQKLDKIRRYLHQSEYEQVKELIANFAAKQTLEEAIEKIPAEQAEFAIRVLDAIRDGCWDGDTSKPSHFGYLRVTVQT